MSDLKARLITQTPTVTAGAYSANDAVGGRLEFAEAFTAEDGSNIHGAILESVVVTDLAKQDIALDLVLFSAAFTATADNGAFDVADADMLKLIGVVNLTNYADFNDNSAVTRHGIGLVIKNTDGTGKLYGQLVTRGTPTYAGTSDITVRVGIVRG